MNKKLIATLVMSTVVASAFAVNAGAASDKQVLKDEKGAVHTINGKLGKVSGASAEARALAALDKVKDNYGFTKAEGNFKVRKSEKDELGKTHTKMDRVINGIPVFGAEMIVHETNGDVEGITGSFATLAPTATAAKIDASQAIDAAVKHTGFEGQLRSKSDAVLTYVPSGDKAVLAYQVGVRYMAEQPGNWTIFVNAVDGSIVDAYNAVHQVVGTGTGVAGDTKSINTTLRSGLYYMEDTTKAMYTTNGGIIDTYDWKNTTTNQYYLSDSDNVWNTTAQRAGVDAHFYAGKTYDYYKNTLGRNSYNNAGATLYSGVHYSTAYNNAFWNGQEMTYGDGDGTTFRALSGSYDVVAHELTHAVTEYTSKLVYQNQSGALNESWSDAMASVMDSADWLIGEDVYTPATAGDALRSMSNPTLYGQPAHMSNYNNTTADNGGVHTNSGIPNKAFYNYATAIGSRDVAGKVWYKAATSYMTSTTNFSGARAATLNAAAALYGTSSTYYTQLATAWSNVGVN